MSANKDLQSIISKAYEIITPYVDVIDANGDIKSKSINLSSSLENDYFLKVPFIGDFNAGKSSLLNALMKRPELLPTNITPETALSYELLYSTDEKLEIVKDGNVRGTKPLSEIGKFTVSAGEIVRVYVDSEFVHNLNDHGIIPVDMPGISSGVEQHNNAIMNYIQEGTVFVVCSDVEQGTLAHSTISFLQEVKAFGLKTIMLVTKSDLKDAEEGKKVKDVVANYASQLMGSDTPTLLVSALEPDTWTELKSVLENLDSDSLVHEKYDDLVKILLEDIISALVMQINILSTKDESLAKKVDELKQEKENAIKRLKQNSDAAQPINGSADDIIQDVRNALMMRATSIATLLLNGGKAEQVNAEILSVIRPVLINSFKRELEEYQLQIGDTLKDFSDHMSKIIEGDSAIKPEQFLGDLIKQDVLEALIKKGITALIAKVAGKKALVTILGMVAKVAAPIASIVIFILPDLLSLIFGKSQSKKLQEIKEKVQSNLIERLAAEMRPQIETLIEESRQEAYDAVELLINEQVEKYDEAISKLVSENKILEEQKASVIQSYQYAIEDLKQLISSL
jgi:GTP-binding protein EngB required for normal cell division